MRIFIFLFGFSALQALPATAGDMFDYFEQGTWGAAHRTCEKNPTQIQFSPDRKRVEFRYPQHVYDYAGEWKQQHWYSVFSSDSDGIVMALDDEQRRTPDGKLVVWVLKPLPDDMYCWGRTDWPSTGCIIIYVRCPELPPLS